MWALVNGVQTCALPISFGFPSGGQKFVGRAEELIVNAIGRDARERQGGNRVAQEGPRPADIVVAVCDRGVGDQPFVGDDPGPVVVASFHLSRYRRLVTVGHATRLRERKITVSGKSRATL